MQGTKPLGTKKFYPNIREDFEYQWDPVLEAENRRNQNRPVPALRAEYADRQSKQRKAERKKAPELSSKLQNSESINQVLTIVGDGGGEVPDQVQRKLVLQEEALYLKMGALKTKIEEITKGGHDQYLRHSPSSQRANGKAVVNFCLSPSDPKKFESQPLAKGEELAILDREEPEVREALSNSQAERLKDLKKYGGQSERDLLQEIQLKPSDDDFNLMIKPVVEGSELAKDKVVRLHRFSKPALDPVPLDETTPLAALLNQQQEQINFHLAKVQLQKEEAELAAQMTPKQRVQDIQFRQHRHQEIFSLKKEPPELMNSEGPYFEGNFRIPSQVTFSESSVMHSNSVHLHPQQDRGLDLKRANLQYQPVQVEVVDQSYQLYSNSDVRQFRQSSTNSPYPSGAAVFRYSPNQRRYVIDNNAIGPQAYNASTFGTQVSLLRSSHIIPGSSINRAGPSLPGSHVAKGSYGLPAGAVSRAVPSSQPGSHPGSHPGSNPSSFLPVGGPYQHPLQKVEHPTGPQRQEPGEADQSLMDGFQQLKMGALLDNFKQQSDTPESSVYLSQSLAAVASQKQREQEQNCSKRQDLAQEQTDLIGEDSSDYANISLSDDFPSSKGISVPQDVIQNSYSTNLARRNEQNDQADEQADLDEECDINTSNVCIPDGLLAIIQKKSFKADRTAEEQEPDRVDELQEAFRPERNVVCPNLETEIQDYSQAEDKEVPNRDLEPLRSLIPSPRALIECGRIVVRNSSKKKRRKIKNNSFSEARNFLQLNKSKGSSDLSQVNIPAQSLPAIPIQNEKFPGSKFSQCPSSPLVSMFNRSNFPPPISSENDHPSIYYYGEDSALPSDRKVTGPQARAPISRNGRSSYNNQPAFTQGNQVNKETVLFETDEVNSRRQVHTSLSVRENQLSHPSFQPSNQMKMDQIYTGSLVHPGAKPDPTSQQSNYLASKVYQAHQIRQMKQNQEAVSREYFECGASKQTSPQGKSSRKSGFVVVDLRASPCLKSRPSSSLK